MGSGGGRGGGGGLCFTHNTQNTLILICANSVRILGPFLLGQALCQCTHRTITNYMMGVIINKAFQLVFPSS